MKICPIFKAFSIGLSSNWFLSFKKEKKLAQPTCIRKCANYSENRPICNSTIPKKKNLKQGHEINKEKLPKYNFIQNMENMENKKQKEIEPNY